MLRETRERDRPDAPHEEVIHDEPHRREPARQRPALRRLQPGPRYVVVRASPLRLTARPRACCQIRFAYVSNLTTARTRGSRVPDTVVASATTPRPRLRVCHPRRASQLRGSCAGFSLAFFLSPSRFLTSCSDTSMSGASTYRRGW